MLTVGMRFEMMGKNLHQNNYFYKFNHSETRLHSKTNWFYHLNWIAGQKWLKTAVTDDISRLPPNILERQNEY